MPTLPQIESLENRRLLSASPVVAPSTPHPVKALHAAKPPHSAKNVRTFSDRTFKDSDWTTSDTSTTGSSTAKQVKNGGFPGSFRQITDTVASHSTYYVVNVSRKAKYNAAKLGAITSITYSESNKLIDGFGDGQATGAALIQNGKLYLATGTGVVTPQSDWKTVVIPNLTAANFGTLDTGEHPDFSQSGAPIQFGFYRGNTSIGASYTISAAIDNWTVKITTLKTKGS